MSLLDLACEDGRQWVQVRERFAVTKKPRDFDLAALDAVPFFPMETIPQDGSYEPSKITARAPNEISSGTYFENGDLLVSKITPSFENGKQALMRSLGAAFGYATTEVIPLHALSPESDSRLLFFYLRHPDIRHYIAERMEGSTGRQRVPESLLLDLPMPDLDPSAQRRAADALELIQCAGAVEVKILTTAKEAKEAAMRRLFTRGMRGEAQKESEVGLIPESWELVQLGDVREYLQYGTSVACTLEEKKYPVLRIPNIEPGRVKTTELKYCDLRPEQATKYLLEPGDLLFIRTNGVVDRLGSCAVFEGAPTSALFASYLIRARLSDRALPKFVANFFGSSMGTALVAGRATPASDGKYNLNTGTIDSLPLPLPPTADEQQEIVAVLDAIDRKIDLHQRKRDLLDELFESLLHKLMTGEVTVDDLDLSALPTSEGSAA